MKIVAFGHKSRVGKDTACQILIDHFKTNYPNLVVERKAFADSVKDISYKLFKSNGLKARQYYDEWPKERSTKLQPLNMDAVEIWVAVGNKIREIYPQTWIDIILKDNSCDILIISDLRYPNELQEVKNQNGICVKIEKDSAEIRNTVADNALNDYTDWNLILKNNESIEDFRQNLLSQIVPLLI